MSDEEVGLEEEVSLKPFRLLEPRVRQLVSTVVPRSLAALCQHRENIARAQRQRAWEKVNAEQINATRTTQQLKDYLRTLEELRGQVRQSDIQQFDTRVEDIKSQLEQSLQSYGVVVSPPKAAASAAIGDEVSDGTSSSHHDDMTSSQFEVVPSTIADHSSTNVETQESWDQLKTELDELQEIMAALTAEIKSQRSAVAHVREEVDSAAIAIGDGKTDLLKATRHNVKAYVFPVGGAVVLGVLGALVGGPVGMVAGANIGAAAALTGVTAGSISGGLLGRKIYKSTLPSEEIELKEVKKTQ